MMPDLPAYTWSPGKRQFRDASGRFVSRAEVRGALDSYLDTVTAEIRDGTQSLVDGSIGIDQWSARMERAIKDAHTAAGAIAAGGWEQATSADWAQVGRKVKFQYQKLRDFARELENGLPLGPGVIARAEMYGISATGTYEAVLRNGDIANGYDRERRILHSENSCKQCLRYAAMGWQPAGTLPGIGEQCSCMSNCRCTFDRKRSADSRLRRRELSGMGLFARITEARAEFARRSSTRKAAAKPKGVATAATGIVRCCKGPGGKFAPGNNYAFKGGTKIPATRTAASPKGAVLDKMARQANVKLESTRLGSTPAQKIVARSKAAAINAARASAREEKRQARNAKARERYAAKKEAAKEARATPISRMVAKSRDAAAKAAERASSPTSKAEQAAIARENARQSAIAKAESRRVAKATPKAKITPDNVEARVQAARAAQKAAVKASAGTGKASDAEIAAVAKARAERLSKAAPTPADTRTPDERWRAAGIQPQSVGTGRGTFKPAAPTKAEMERARLAQGLPLTRGIGGREPDLRNQPMAGPRTDQAKALEARAAAKDRMVRQSREAAWVKKQVVNKRAAAAPATAKAATGSGGITPVTPPPPSIRSKPISDPARLKAETQKLDEAFARAPGSRDNFVTLAALHKTMPHLSQPEFRKVIDKGLDDGKFTLSPEEGRRSFYQGLTAAEVKAAGIPTKGIREGQDKLLVYIARRDR